MAGRIITCRDIDGNPHEVPLEQLSFRPSAYGVIVYDGKVLLTRFKDGYDFPGGGIALGERIADAIAREVREETGVSVQVDTLLHVEDDFFTHPVTKKSHHTLLLFYACSNPTGEISTEMFDASDHALGTERAEWLPVEEAYTVKFYNPIDSAGLIRKVASGQ